MPASSGVTSLTSAGAVIAQPGGTSNNRDNVGTLQVSGTYGTCVGSVRGSKDIVGTASPVWSNLDLVRMDTLAIELTPTLTDNTTRTWKFDCTGFQQVEFNLSSIGSGSIRCQLDTGFYPANPIGTQLASSLSGNQAITGTMTVTSTSASALAVGANGSTNPVFVVDDSGVTPQTGISVKGAAAASGVAVQVITTGTNEDVTIDAAAAGTVKIGTVASTALGAQVGSSTSAANATLIVQSTNLKALVVGRLGATTPAFQVDANTATSITGVKVKSAATGNGVAISAIGEASNGALKIDAQGTGVLALGDTSTGGVGLNRGILQALQVGQTLTALGTSQSSAPTAAQLLGGILTQTGATGAGAITLPTGTAVSAACPRTPATGDTFECTFVNVGGGQTLTVTGATNTTVVGGATIATAKSAKLIFTCTGSNAWSIYVIGG